MTGADDKTTQLSAQSAVDKGRVAFRLVEETKAFLAPDDLAAVTAVLPAGSLMRWIEALVYQAVHPL